MHSILTNISDYVVRLNLDQIAYSNNDAELYFEEDDRDEPIDYVKFLIYSSIIKLL